MSLAKWLLSFMLLNGKSVAHLMLIFWVFVMKKASHIPEDYDKIVCAEIPNAQVSYTTQNCYNTDDAWPMWNL